MCSVRVEYAKELHQLSIISRFGTQLGCLLLLVSVAKVFRRLSTTRSAPDMRHITLIITLSCVFRSLLFSPSSQRYRSTSESLRVLSSHKPNKKPSQALHPLPSNPKPATPPPPPPEELWRYSEAPATDVVFPQCLGIYVCSSRSDVKF